MSGADGFSRIIPIAKALHADTLLAYNMNGERLLVNHGLPLRAVVPGWYGMDSVKWLREIEVLREEVSLASLRHPYLRLTRSLLAGTRPAGPVRAMNVKSVFSRPMEGAILMSRKFIIRGAAWAGENRVQTVEVSTNGGKIWQQARLDGQPQPYSWITWAYTWQIPSAGPHDLIVRAMDDQGRRQPESRDPERADGYELNDWQRIRVIAA
jgi:DMSO/TMAO reductase YedYZ molybdopterin-dependent catalytic subunit